MDEVILYRAVTDARAAIYHGVRGREAAMMACQQHGLMHSVEVVLELAVRAESACADARERLAVKQNMQDHALEVEQDQSPLLDTATRQGVSLGEFAVLIGRSPSFVSGLKKAGRLVMVEEFRVDALASLALLEVNQ